MCWRQAACSLLKNKPFVIIRPGLFKPHMLKAIGQSGRHLHISTINLSFCSSGSCILLSFLKRVKTAPVLTAQRSMQDARFSFFTRAECKCTKETNVKSIPSYIKHLRVSKTAARLLVTSTMAFSPRCHTASCILTGASTWQVTALNGAGGDE